MKLFNRTKKENRDQVISLRLTKKEYDLFNKNKIDMQFSSTVDTLVFSVELTEWLKSQHDKGLSIYIGKDLKDLNEVKFEFVLNDPIFKEEAYP